MRQASYPPNRFAELLPKIVHVGQQRNDTGRGASTFGVSIALNILVPCSNIDYSTAMASYTSLVRFGSSRWGGPSTKKELIAEFMGCASSFCVPFGSLAARAKATARGVFLIILQHGGPERANEASC